MKIEFSTVGSLLCIWCRGQLGHYGLHRPCDGKEAARRYGVGKFSCIEEIQLVSDNANQFPGLEKAYLKARTATGRRAPDR